MKAHLSISKDEKKVISELEETTNISAEDFEVFVADEYTIGYNIKNIRTGEFVDTGIRVFKQNIGLYSDLNEMVKQIRDILVEEKIAEKSEQASTMSSSEKFDVVMNDILSVSRRAERLFDDYFGEGSLKGIISARFGVKFTPFFAFTLSAISHLGAAAVLGTSQEVAKMTRNAVNITLATETTGGATE